VNGRSGHNPVSGLGVGQESLPMGIDFASRQGNVIPGGMTRSPQLKARRVASAKAMCKLSCPTAKRGCECECFVNRILVRSL
jgi:hypothetical protein